MSNVFEVKVSLLLKIPSNINSGISGKIQIND